MPVHASISYRHAERPADLLGDRSASSANEDSAFEPIVPSQVAQPPDRISNMWHRFRAMRTGQQAYLACGALVLLWLTPALLQFGMVGVERAVVGGLLAIEELLLLAVRKLAALGAWALLAMAVVAGVYVFVGDRDRD